jgi:hypothetical protein
MDQTASKLNYLFIDFLFSVAPFFVFERGWVRLCITISATSQTCPSISIPVSARQLKSGG